MIFPSALRNELKKLVRQYTLHTRGYLRYRGKQLFASSKSHIADRIIREGGYEPEITELILGLCHDGSTFIDVGANIGAISLAVLANNPTIKSVSIECSPSTLPFLRKTVELSGLRSRWRIDERAICENAEFVDFYTRGADFGAFDGLKDTGRGGNSTKLSIPATTLDQVWEDCGRPRVDVIKIDVEGGECGVIRSGLACILSENPALMIEWNAENLSAHNIDPLDIFELALQTRSEIYSIPSLINVTPRTLRLHMTRTEMFLLIPEAN